MLEVLSVNDSAEGRQIPSKFQFFANQHLTLLTGERLIASTAVSVKCDDVLFLGEVVNSIPSADDQWTIDIKVAHTLADLQSLMNVRTWWTSITPQATKR